MRYPTAEAARYAVAVVVLSALCTVFSSGCGRSAPPAGDAQLRAAMKLLGLQYGSYLADKGGPPPDESALRNYLQSRLTVLRDYGVKSVDDLLRLGRDGQPLHLIYGRKVPLPEHPEYGWVAHELSGIDGKRLACDSRGGIYEITDAEFSQLLAGK
jgi:hypothetical protein